MNISQLKENLILPVIGAPMFLISGPELVIEQCKNGIIGTIPALNLRTSESFEQCIIQIKEGLNNYEQETAKKAAPFGVNIIVHHTNPRAEADLRICAKHKVPLIITSLGAVKMVVDVVKGYGGMIFHDVIKRRHAEKATEAGVDGIIAVCAGAGGHAGTASPFALIKEIKSFFDKTVILAGSISTGADIKATQILGADFAYIGTRFINTQESLAPLPYKNMIIQSGIDDIIYTDKVSGVNANFLKGSIDSSVIDNNKIIEEDFSKLNDGNKAWKDIWSAGHGVASINDIPSVKELILQMKKEYDDVKL